MAEQGLQPRGSEAGAQALSHLLDRTLISSHFSHRSVKFLFQKSRSFIVIPLLRNLHKVCAQAHGQEPRDLGSPPGRGRCSLPGLEKKGLIRPVCGLAPAEPMLFSPLFLTLLPPHPPLPKASVTGACHVGSGKGHVGLDMGAASPWPLAVHLTLGVLTGSRFSPLSAKYKFDSYIFKAFSEFPETHFCGIAVSPGQAS